MIVFSVLNQFDSNYSMYYVCVNYIEIWRQSLSQRYQKRIIEIILLKREWMSMWVVNRNKTRKFTTDNKSTISYQANGIRIQKLCQGVKEV